MENMQLQYRVASIELSRGKDGKGTLSATLSSESPIKRSYGYEVLSHSPDAIRLERAKRGLPLLWAHDQKTIVGRVVNVRLQDRKLKGDLLPGNSRPDLWSDVNEGIIKDISIGYVLHDSKPVRKGDQYIYRDWEPFEASLVAIPADATVGIGRTYQYQKKGGNKMDIEVKEEEIKKAERRRMLDYQMVMERHPELKDLALRYIEEGRPFSEFGQEAIKRLGNVKPIDSTSPEIGMSRRELREYSILRAIRASIPDLRERAGLEMEASQAVAKRLGKSPRGSFYIPHDILMQKRDLVVGTPTAGGNLVATDLLAGSFIELLRNRLVIGQLATILSGLVGDVAIPSQTGGATAYWLAENTDITESQQTFGQVALTPKTVGALTEISRKLILQSTPSAEQLVRNDLTTIVATEIDRAAINGSGTGSEPTGVLNTTGIGDVAIGTDGGAPTYTHILSLIESVASANADMGTRAFLTNSVMEKKLLEVEKSSGTAKFVLEYADDGTPMMIGRKVYVTNQVPSNLVKGTSSDCSAIIYGNWQDLVIGLWGALDVLVDPYTGSASGRVRVRVLQDVDIAVRHPESFAAIKDARNV